jgi:hypothetical protein
MSLIKNSPAVPKNVMILGLSDRDTDFTWTDGQEVVIQFPIKRIDGQIIFSFYATPFIVPGIVEEQRIKVVVNNHELTTLKISEPGQFFVDIPGELVSDDMYLKLLMLDAISPVETGLNNDSRTLGLAFAWMRFEEEK